ncbi:MAG: hypothetical protein DI568_01255 [Sphingomonas sp.]|nr:MAG: hypothetical protein DI568_01255 [Sphingomonas sp.]
MANIAFRQGGEIDALLDSAPISGFQIRVALLCAAVAMLDGFDTQAIAFVAPVIGELWDIPPAHFGLIFSAGLLGILVGQLVAGPLSDRWGRRPVILGCTALFGAFTFATLLADGWTSLIILRFLTGIGLGGATPNLITLTCEISPPRARATMITSMFAGFPLGAALGGFVSSYLIPAFGWQSVFLLGGTAPLILLGFLFVWLPESPHILFHRRRNPEQLARMLDRIAGKDRPPLSFAPEPLDVAEPARGYPALFAGQLAPATMLLWLAYFNSLLMVYFLMSWLPTIARQSGLSLDTAIISAVFLNLGGALGGVLLGRIADRYGAFQVLAAAYALAGLCLALIGLAGAQTGLLMGLAFLAGLCTIGGQTAMNAATTGLYPAELRATGLGAALAVGRAGSIFGPWIGGLLLATHWSPSGIFMAAALPALLTAGISLSLVRAVQSRKDRILA